MLRAAEVYKHVQHCTRVSDYSKKTKKPDPSQLPLSFTVSVTCSFQSLIIVILIKKQ